MSRYSRRNRDWGHVRTLVLFRDGYECQIRGSRCTGVATEVDHIVPLEQGGEPLDPANLRAACRPCNAAGGAVVTNRKRRRRGDDVPDWWKP